MFYLKSTLRRKEEPWPQPSRPTMIKLAFDLYPKMNQTRTFFSSTLEKDVVLGLEEKVAVKACLLIMDAWQMANLALFSMN